LNDPGSSAVPDRTPRTGDPSIRAELSELARIVEALLFLSPEPVAVAELAEACEADAEEVGAALAELGEALDGRGLFLREVAGGWTLATDPGAEEAARRLLARPRTPPLTPAQAEALSIVAYLQPVSRPEMARIRGVASDSATATLLERGLIEEAGRSQFGAVLYRTTPRFLKLFGLKSLDDLPDVARWDPSPEEEAELRDRLLRAGDARAGAEN
jgi:segregation and condensation protein B